MNDIQKGEIADFLRDHDIESAYIIMKNGDPIVINPEGRIHDPG